MPAILVDRPRRSFYSITRHRRTSQYNPQRVSALNNSRIMHENLFCLVVWCGVVVYGMVGLLRCILLRLPRQTRNRTTGTHQRHQEQQTATPQHYLDPQVTCVHILSNKKLRFKVAESIIYPNDASEKRGIIPRSTTVVLL